MKLLLFLLPILLFSKENFPFSFFKKGDNNSSKPTALFIGGVQGDEPGGFHAAALLVTNYSFSNGNVWIVPNLNFYSIIKRSRGVYGDMNRKFHDISKKDPDYESVERVKKLILKPEVDLIVHLHDGSGFYNPKYIDKEHNPSRWGQCSIIDQKIIKSDKYNNLEKIATKVIENINSNLKDPLHRYYLHNTKTNEGDKEMEKTLTYFAITHGKPAFGNEASKNLPTYMRVYYHLLAIEGYLKYMGIKYKRTFKLTPINVYRAINIDTKINLYDNQSVLPTKQLKRKINFFPIKMDKTLNFKSNNPLISVHKKGKYYKVQYGNRSVTLLKPELLKYDNSIKDVTMIIDNRIQIVPFGTILNVKKTFFIFKQKNIRVNVIGYKKKGVKNEINIHFRKNMIKKRFAIDRKNKIYRVEFYTGKIYHGMILVKFL
jgi:hypothetical protein